MLPLHPRVSGRHCPARSVAHSHRCQHTSPKRQRGTLTTPKRQRGFCNSARNARQHVIRRKYSRSATRNRSKKRESLRHGLAIGGRAAGSVRLEGIPACKDIGRHRITGGPDQRRDNMLRGCRAQLSTCQELADRAVVPGGSLPSWPFAIRVLVIEAMVPVMIVAMPARVMVRVILDDGVGAAVTCAVVVPQPGQQMESLPKEGHQCKKRRKRAAKCAVLSDTHISRRPKKMPSGPTYWKIVVGWRVGSSAGSIIILFAAEGTAWERILFVWFVMRLKASAKHWHISYMWTRGMGAKCSICYTHVHHVPRTRAANRRGDGRRPRAAAATDV